MNSFDGEITFADTLDISGNYGFKPLFNKGYYLSIVSFGLKDTNGLISRPTLVLTTPGVEGLDNNQSHSIDIFAYTTSLLTLRLNGSVDVKNT
jgi:hypothetical protein